MRKWFVNRNQLFSEQVKTGKHKFRSNSGKGFDSGKGESKHSFFL